MLRRSLLASLFMLAACATQPPPPPAQGFSSDRITIATRGAGPDVILIPGMGSHPDVWDATAAALEGDYRLHIVHVNGFAGMPARGNANGLVAAPVAEEIARYIAEQHLDHPAVIGHSMGGTIGMMLAARHPDSVGKLEVVDMSPFIGLMFGGPDATPDSVRPIADGMRNQIRSAPAGMASPVIEQMYAGMVRTEGERANVVQHARESDMGVIANSFHELITTDLRQELSHITAPVTVLYVIPPNLPMPAEQYEALMVQAYANAPSPHIVKFDTAYHFIMLDEPERFIAETRAFLGG